MTAPLSPPLACDLSALSAEERERHAQLWTHIRTLAPEPASTPYGIAFSFEPSTSLATELAELAALERRCCPFLRISVRFEPAGGPLSFELGGDEHVRSFLAAGFGADGVPKA